MEKFPSLFSCWNIFCQMASIIAFNMRSDFEELHYNYFTKATHSTNPHYK